MFRLFPTPIWFNSWDIAFGIVIFLVALLIAGYSWRIFRLHKENRFAYFALAFIMIASSLFFKVMTNGVLYFQPIRDTAANVLQPIATPNTLFADLFYRLGFFLEMAPMLGGLLLIYLVSQKKRERLNKYYEVSQIALFIYLVLLISIVSNFTFFVFYLTSTVLLALIVLNYYKNYLNNSNKNTFKVMIAFLLGMFANIFFIFVFIWEGFYFFGETLLLIGFLILLITYNRIMRSK
ncbi:hypothetical protein HYX11_02150 [Candidatus Woesearchaeota archaeon]|nr:hypothetical protein [Candidatus Woesearchaeota archaeon]